MMRHLSYQVPVPVATSRGAGANCLSSVICRLKWSQSGVRTDEYRWVRVGCGCGCRWTESPDILVQLQAKVRSQALISKLILFFLIYQYSGVVLFLDGFCSDRAIIKNYYDTRYSTRYHGSMIPGPWHQDCIYQVLQSEFCMYTYHMVPGTWYLVLVRGKHTKRATQMPHIHGLHRSCMNR